MSAAPHPLLTAVVDNDLALLENSLLLSVTPKSLSAIRSTDGKTAVHLASLLGFHDCLHRLLELGAPADPLVPLLLTVDQRGDSPLHLATLMNHPKCASLLLSAGSLPFHPRNLKGQSPFDLIDNDSMRKVYSEHLLHTPTLDLRNDSPLRSSLYASLPTDTASLQDLVISLALAATLFESSARDALRRCICNPQSTLAQIPEPSTRSINQSMASRETQLQYLVEENEHLSRAAATLRRHIRALEQDIEAKDEAFRTHLAELYDGHRRELSQMKHAHARHEHELNRQISLRTVTHSAIERVDSAANPTSYISESRYELVGDVDTVAVLESVNFELSEKLRIVEESNASLKSDLEALRRSLMRPDIYENAKLEKSSENGLDEAMGLIIYATGVTGDMYIKAAAVDVLVDRLVSGHPVDYSFRTTFLLTFREFLTPEEFLSKLQSSRIPGNSVTALRIGDIVSDWIKRFFWPDFSKKPVLLRRVMSFLHDDLAPDDRTASVPRIEELVQARLATWFNMENDSEVFTSLITHLSPGRRNVALLDPPKSIIPKYLRRVAPPTIGSLQRIATPPLSNAVVGPNHTSSLPLPVSNTTNEPYTHEEMGSWLPGRAVRSNDTIIKLGDWDMLEVARQLTLIESELFRSISPMELVGLKWMHKDKDEVSPTVMRMTRWSNHIVQWIISEIVATRDLKARATVYERFIYLASELAKLNNFNGLKEILAALDSSSVFRLRKTKALVSRKALKLHDALRAQISPHMNHKSLRKEIRSAEPPLIPFPGLMQTDLLYIDTVFPKQVEGLVNFVRCQKLADHVLEIQEQQDLAWYNLDPVPEIVGYVMDYKVMDEDSAYARSLACEGRS